MATGPFDQAELDLQRKDGRLPRVALDVTVAVPPERDLAKQCGHLAIGRFVIQSAVISRLVMHVVRQRFRLGRFELIVNVLGDLPAKLSHLVGQFAFNGEHGGGIRLVVQKTLSPVRRWIARRLRRPERSGLSVPTSDLQRLPGDG